MSHPSRQKKTFKVYIYYLIAHFLFQISVVTVKDIQNDQIFLLDVRIISAERFFISSYCIFVDIQ